MKEYLFVNVIRWLIWIMIMNMSIYRLHQLQVLFIVQTTNVDAWPKPDLPTDASSAPWSSLLKCSHVHYWLVYIFCFYSWVLWTVAASMGCPGYPWISLRFQCFTNRWHFVINPVTYFDILLNNRTGVQLAGYPQDSKEMPPLHGSTLQLKINYCRLNSLVLW